MEDSGDVGWFSQGFGFAQPDTIPAINRERTKQQKLYVGFFIKMRLKSLTFISTNNRFLKWVSGLDAGHG
jgi:hypothetical protein